jgi:hypothetical protein
MLPKFLTGCILLLVLEGCGKHDSSQLAGTSVSGANVAVSAQAPNSASPAADRLLASAEPFELLTEGAFTDPVSRLDQMIAHGRDAVGGIRSLLSPGAARRTDELLAALQRDRANGKRADLALSSIEIYRILVSSVGVRTKIPADVSLLDYAGFRFQADLQAKPVRWDDMREAILFANNHWVVIASRVSDKSVSVPLETALSQMAIAVEHRDPMLAATAVNDELNQVDKLEAYFNTRGAPKPSI